MHLLFLLMLINWIWSRDAIHYYWKLGHTSCTHVHKSILTRIITRSLAIAERPTWRSVSAEILVHCCTNNANRLSWGALSAAATFYSTTCIVLCMHYCTRHNCRKLRYSWHQQDWLYGSLLITHTALHSEHAVPCVLPTNVCTTSLGDVNCTITVIDQCCRRHRVLLRQCTIMDTNHWGRWTQRFQTEI